MKEPERLVRGRAVSFVAASFLVLSCGGGGAEPSTQAKMEFRRHLRLGIEQLRRYLPDSARAEFDKCAKIDPGDPELLFHQARLALFPTREGRSLREARALLQEALEVEPRSVKTLRLLGAVERMAGHRRSSAAQEARIAEIYGPIGQMEAVSLESYLEGGRPPHVRLLSTEPVGTGSHDYRAAVDAFRGLERAGRYAPSKAVPILEGIFRKYPDLTVLRLEYARILVMLQVRVNYAPRPDVPLMSSKLILDMAQAHLESVFDQLPPASPLAMEAIFELGMVALSMADYDEVVTLNDILLEYQQSPPSQKALQVARQALARHRQGRNAESIELFKRVARILGERRLESVAGLPLLWLMHLAHEEAGTDPSERELTFRFRRNLKLHRGDVALEFEDIAPRLGIDKLDGLGPSAWADYDRDGDFDLFVCGCDSYGVLYRNDGDLFTDVSREAGIFRVQSGYSATFADYDNDGWADLYVGRDGWNGPAPNSLYRNNGDGTFTDVTETAGVGHPGSSFVHAWSDVDRDGDLDVFVVNGITGSGDTNVLYRNNGDGTFADVTTESGLREPAGTRTIAAAFGDYDQDGWPDIFVSGYEMPNRLYHNKGDGTFEEVARKAGVRGDDAISKGYVSFFVDYDNDLRPDILRTSLAPWEQVLLGLSWLYDSLPDSDRKTLLQHCPKLYRNKGDGSFEDVSEQAGFVHPVGIMGAGVADLDNDGYVDLYFGTGDPRVERLEPDRFFRNNGDGTFTDLTFATGLGNVGKGHGVTFVDHDGDGDLEIYAPEGGFVHGDQWPNSFYLNEQRSGNHWLHVDLEGEKSNRGAVDARLVVTAGKLHILREVRNGEGFGSSNSPTVEFGLGRARKVDRLEVHWPSGTVQAFDDVPIDRRIFVREGDSSVTVHTHGK